MMRRTGDELALRREALATRAALQRIELAVALDRARDASLARQGIGALALRLARSFAAPRSGSAPASRARPWMLSVGWLLIRALRTSPTARWVAGAAALGGAIWWVARALRERDAPDDGSG
ncbi:MAG TPA: hypothetical protein VFN64_14740 [Burkholderiaceae bacterium]|nr:hypothetical protein [Burkholderiaceae bacterium]